MGYWLHATEEDTRDARERARSQKGLCFRAAALGAGGRKQVFGVDTPLASVTYCYVLPFFFFFFKFRILKGIGEKFSPRFLFERRIELRVPKGVC